MHSNIDDFLNCEVVYQKTNPQKKEQPFNPKTYDWRAFINDVNLKTRFENLVKASGDNAVASISKPAEFVSENLSGMNMNTITITSAPLLIATGCAPSTEAYDKLKNVPDLCYLVPCFHAIYLALTVNSLPVRKRCDNLFYAVILFVADICSASKDFSFSIFGRVLTNVQWMITLVALKSSSKFAPVFYLISIIIQYHILRCCLMSAIFIGRLVINNF